MKKIIMLSCLVLVSFVYAQDSQSALYKVKSKFEQEVYKAVQIQEQQKIADALSLANHTDIQDFISFLEENSSQSSIQQALYISAAFHIHARLSSEIASLVKTMHMLQEHVRFWQKELVYEQAPAYNKSPDRWRYADLYTKTMQTRLKQAQDAQDVLAVQLGKYLYLMYQLSMIQNIHDIQKFVEIMAKHEFFGAATLISIPHPAIQSAYALHKHAENVQKFCQQVIVYTKIPSHIQRNKLAYGASLLSLVVTSMLLYKNVDAIKSGAQEVGSAFQNFIEDNVKGPVQKIADVFFNKNVIERKSLEESKFDTSGDIDLLHKIAVKHGFSLEGLSPEEMNEVIEKVVEKQNDYLTRALYISSFFDPENAQKSLDAGSFKATLLILQGKNSMNNAFDALEAPLAEGNNILDQMKLMVPMMALTPAAFLGWIGYKTTGGLYEFLFKRKFITQPFKNALRMIHTILNEHIHMQEKEYRAEGYLYFYTYILDSIGEKLSLQQQEIFYEDVALLQKYEYSYEQKCNIVQRMYATYSFLHQ